MPSTSHSHHESIIRRCFHRHISQPSQFVTYLLGPPEVGAAARLHTHTQLIGTFSSSVMKHIGHVTGNGPALGHFVSGPLFFFSWHKTKEKVKKSATPAVSRLQIQQAAPRTRRAEQTCPSAQSIGGNLFFWFRSIC